MDRSAFWRRACAVLLLSAATAIILPAQILTTLTSFNGTNGSYPTALVQGNDGNFYGTAGGGGSNKACVSGCGTIFKVTPAGTLTTLYSFSGGTDGSAPSVLVQAIDGNFYGTTSGLNVFGQFAGIEPTIFKITSGGVLTTLYRSDATDGSEPSVLVGATDGNLYGMTSGTNIDGTIFRITPGGTLTTLYSFCRQGTIPYCPDGDTPGALVQGTDGNFYGTTLFGGTGSNAGTIFKITPGGTLTTLYSFGGGADGDTPRSLVQGIDGNFYGTTNGGFGLYPYGTIFKFPPAGRPTTLYACPYPAYPSALVQGTDGNFYGTTFNGTIFKITPGGALTTLYSFSGGTEGPGALVRGTDGNFYGTTQYGGADNRGTVFRLTTSATLPTIAPSGGVVNGASFQTGIGPNSWITIFGTNLSSKTDTWGSAIVDGKLPMSLDGVSVSVGGQPAYISYISPTQINALLAPNVATGKVSVTVTNLLGTSAPVTAVLQMPQPAFFQWGSYAVATRQDFSPAVKGGTFPGLTTVPAKPGDIIILWGTGFGPTSPLAPVGAEVPSSPTYYTASSVSVTVGNTPATVYGTALSPGYAGLYQVGIQIPTSLANGDYSVVATVPGARSPSSTLITVQK